MVRLLVASGKNLSSQAQAQILALGEQAIPQLLAVLTSPTLANQNDPGEGWAPLHAARLLGELRALSAIESLLDVLYDSDPVEYLYSALIDALAAMGPPALELLLAAQARFEKPGEMNPIPTILCKLGVPDPRIFAVLLAGLQTDPSIGASNLAEYGDPAALPYLMQALDAYRLTSTDSPIEHHAVIELTSAIEELGGELSLAQRAKASAADAPRRRFAEILTRAAERMPTTGLPASKVGRNHPCPCGSGKKYKKCHLLQ